MQNLTLPGSKSITNRDLILCALADGESILKGFLDSEDTKYMIKALQDFGIEVTRKNNETLIINGGKEKLKAPKNPIFLGQSGTCLRFLIGLAILVSDENEITFTGEKRLLERPMQDLLDGIKNLGIKTEHKLGEYVKVKKTSSYNPLLKNIVKMNGESSSQFFTSLLQVAPLFENGLEIEVIGDLVSKPYIDITTNEMAKYGVKIKNKDYKYFEILAQKYKSVNIDIEGDASALSYIANYVALHGGEIKINNIGNNSKQGDYKYLDEMKIFGLEYESDGKSTILKKIPHTPHLLTGEGIKEIDFETMPDVSMSFMIMSIFLPGITKITGLKTLNLKECLRIDAMRDELRKLGVKVENDNESITITSPLTPLLPDEENKKKIDIETYNDHRIAMCFGVLNTVLGNLNILNPDCVAKTYPNFWKDLKMLENNK